MSNDTRTAIKILCRVLKFAVSLLEKWQRGEKLD